jgi:hypothetical protein
MTLQLKALRAAARKIISEERAVAALRAEMARALGPIVIVEDCSIDEFVQNVNERLDVLEKTGRISGLRVRHSTLHALVEHNHSGVRKIVARLIDEQYVGKFAKDVDPSVLSVVAKRAPLKVVAEVVKRSRHNEGIRATYRARLKEAGLPNPKPVDEPFDMYGDERIGDAAKTMEEPELSDAWYERKALKMFHDFGHDNLEYNWEETLVNNCCNATLQTSHVEIDKNKLLKALKDVIKQHEDLALERNALKETIDNLNMQALLREETIKLPGLDVDPVAELVEQRLSPHEYIEKANELFKIVESTIPAAIRKYRLGEGNSQASRVPTKATLPNGPGLRAIDELALTTYVRHWNDKQAHRGEPIAIDWVPDPVDTNHVAFTVTLR